jgi:hypothetical protein
VKKLLRVQNSNSYKMAADALVSRWYKAAEVAGDYVEK